ncbi:hypothetical protein CSC12_4383 [Klebsiella michiganensis]|nr:hypothetical protein CSC12_4383 [Klebsiella michiganensis]
MPAKLLKAVTANSIDLFKLNYLSKTHLQRIYFVNKIISMNVI